MLILNILYLAILSLVPLNELSTSVWSTPGIAPAGRLASGADLMGDVSRGHASEVEGSDSMMSYRLQAIDVLWTTSLAIPRRFPQTGLASWS